MSTWPRQTLSQENRDMGLGTVILTVLLAAYLGYVLGKAHERGDYF